MSNFCFFTDADTTGLLDPQDSSDAFGVVSDTEFRVTSLHTAASASRVFAVCDGSVAVQQDSQLDSVVTLILKPKDQPGVDNRINFVALKYIIYKGISKASLIVGSSVAARSKNQLTRRAHVAQDAMNRATEVLLEEPVNSITLTPSSKLFRYDIVGGDGDSLDKLFYKQNNALFEPLSVTCGDYIGDFDNTLFGIEIVLDDVRADANFILTRKIETRLKSPLPTAPNASGLFKRRHQKERATSFMDPCAFFGSFFQYGGVFDHPVKLRYRLSSDTIDVEQDTKDSDLSQAKSSEIYEKLLVHFANKNAVYIDIRNELNTSLNFYQHYGNNVRIRIPKADNEIVNKDYYGNSGWPLLVLQPADFDLHGENNDSDKNVIKIEIALPNPANENAAPVAYISQGNLDKIQRNKVLRGEKRYIRLSAAADGYTELFSVAVANISGESVITPVSQYIRIKYLKSVLQGTSSGIVPRAIYYLDLLFLPFSMKIPFAITANAKSRVYHEDTFLGLSEVSGCESAGAVGIARDSKNTTLFAYAGDKLRTTGTTRLATISLASEIDPRAHYLNVVRDRHKREQLVRGDILPSATYLRFLDTTPGAVSNVSDGNLRDEFVAVLIKKETFIEMALDHGFSNGYDIFMRFQNLFQGVDSAGVAYTRYDLVLEGYIDDGTTISLGSPFDTGVKVYSFGTDRNLIFLDQEAEYDESTPLDVPPVCTDAFSADDLEQLHNFIEDLQASGTPQSFKDLYDKVFNIRGGFKIEVPGPPYILINPYLPLADTKPKLPKGFLAEVCTVFSLYKLDKQLAHDTADAQLNVDIDDPGKSPIYQALKNILREAGFKKPALGLATNTFNKMMNPDANIGVRDERFKNEPTAIKRKMYDLMVIGNSPEHGPASDRNFVSKPPPLSDADIFASMTNILSQYMTTIQQFVEDESACAFKRLSGELVAPSNLFLATGDGTSTTGLLEIPQDPPQNTAVLLFNYEFDNMAGVKSTLARQLASLKTDFSTAVHLSIFGIDDFEDPIHGSTVKVVKDGITYVFEANFAHPTLSPVSGTKQGEAQYSQEDELFYLDTTSVRRPLAFYDPVKRDLAFIERNKTFPFQVELRSYHEGQEEDRGYDEVSVSVNVVEGPEIKQFEFERLFGGDVFVLSPQERSLLLSPSDNAAIDFMIDRLIKIDDFPFKLDLRGDFVGKYIENARDRTAGSKVERDTRYQFDRTRVQGRILEVEQEDEIEYPKLRYGFGRVVVSTSKITITIDSFVSPQWSRLDKEVPSGKQSQLDSLTNYHAHAVDLSDAYLEPPDDFHPTNPALPKLPSYNPILSGLRSFGLAEALKDILVQRGTDSSSYDAFDVAAMKSYLEEKLAQATVLENTTLGVGSAIKFTDYVALKPSP